MLNNVPVCFIILLFASSRRVLLVFSYIFTLLFIFCFACQTTAMFNRFMSIYGSIIAKNGGEKRSREDFCIFSKREISTTGIFLLADDVDSECTNWTMALADSFIETQRKGSRNVIKGFPFNDYSCDFPSVGETLTLHWLNDFRCPPTKLCDLACISSCVPGVVNCSIERQKKKQKYTHTHSYKHSFALIQFNPLPIATLGVSFPVNHTIYWTQTFTNGNSWRHSSVFNYTHLFGSLLCNATPKKKWVTISRRKTLQTSTPYGKR